MKLLIISDTHIDSIEKLPQILIDEISHADAIIHAGDVVGYNLIYQIMELNKNIYAVKGNMDILDVDLLPQTRLLTFEGVKIGIMHGDGYPYNLESRLFYTFPDANIIIHGHTHVPFWGKVDNKFILNPGSPLSNRGVNFNSYAILKIEENTFSTEIKEI